MDTVVIVQKNSICLRFMSLDIYFHIKSIANDMLEISSFNWLLVALEWDGITAALFMLKVLFPAKSIAERKNKPLKFLVT